MDDKGKIENILRDADFKYFDTLLKKARTNHQNHFTLSTQHFDNHREAVQNLSQWKYQHPKEVIGFEINPVEIVVHLHTTI